MHEQPPWQRRISWLDRKVSSGCINDEGGCQVPWKDGGLCTKARLFVTFKQENLALVFCHDEGQALSWQHTPQAYILQRLAFLSDPANEAPSLPLKASLCRFKASRLSSSNRAARFSASTRVKSAVIWVSAQQQDLEIHMSHHCLAG